MKSIALAALALIVALASSAQSGFQNDPQPVLIADKLKQKGVALDRDSLVAALRNGDHEVRSLAASQLASQHAREAYPHILEAYKDEAIPLYRVNLAHAATVLYPERGSLLLRSLCSSHDLAPAWRLLAATYLVELKDPGCLDDVVSVIRTSTDSGDRATALSIIPRFVDLEAIGCREVEPLLESGIRANSAYERSVAVTAFVAACKSEAISHLEAALKIEQEQPLREKIERELKNLQKPKPKPQAQ